MNHVLDTALDRTAVRMENEFGTISRFRWHYYASMLIGMSLLSAVACHMLSNRESETDRILAHTNPAVQCLDELNDIAGKFTK